MNSPIVVHPIILIPGSTPTFSDEDIVESAIPKIQAWFEAQGIWLMLSSVKSVPSINAEDEEWFEGYPGGMIYAVQEWCYKRGYNKQPFERCVVFLGGFPQGHGEAWGRVSIVSYASLTDLEDVALDGIPTWGDRIGGLICHEIGHMLGFYHVNDENDLMHGGINFWGNWPSVGLSQKLVEN